VNRRLGLLVAALLAALFLAELILGTLRLQALTDRQRGRALAELQSQVSRVAGRLEDDLESGKRHARFLAGSDAFESLAAAPSDESRAAAARWASALLVTFPRFGAVTALDAAGSELLRVERMGGGVAVLPSPLLRPNLDAARAHAALARADGSVNLSSLEVDASRVDLAERDRLVLRYDVAIAGGKGVFVLSLYAAPLLDELRRSEPLPGARYELLDETARPLLRDRDAEQSSAAGGDELATVATATGPRRADGTPTWKLLGIAPTEALDRGAAELRQEALLTGAILIFTAAALATIAVVVARLTAAQRRLESEREAAAALAESERLAALGRLTAGVAHEVNNPLAGITNYLALLEREDSDPQRRKEYLELIRHGFARIQTIVRDLLSFARPPKPRREAIELAGVLDRVYRVTHHDRGFREIRWSATVDSGCPQIWGDPFALEQVLLNLALNARDAMTSSSAGRGGPREITIHAGADGDSADRVRITFEDTGPGIPPAALQRIFEPFFTTRETGTGLGLSVTASILSAHGGSIRAENRAEGGARFVITLPSASRQALALETKP